MRADLHTHTVYSDGSASPREMIESAIGKGFDRIGISDHSFTSFDTTYCIPADQIGEYRRCLSALKAEYAGRIEVLTGIEQDYYGDFLPTEYDYVIGSVHYLRCGGEYVPVDENADILQKAAAVYFGGDMLSLCELYFETVSDVVDKTGAGIVGHFDLITKFNEKKALFDEKSERYEKAVRSALDRLLSTGAAFEINTGAILRGYKKCPYPAEKWIRYISDRGGKLILSSDAHNAKSIGFAFSDYEKYIVN